MIERDWQISTSIIGFRGSKRWEVGKFSGICNRDAANQDVVGIRADANAGSVHVSML